MTAISAPTTEENGPARSHPRRRKGSWRDTRVSGWLFMLPLVIINVVVILIPSVSSVYYSLTDWNGISQANFIGLENFQTLFADPEFASALTHNVLWTIFSLTVPMGLGLFGAYALTRIRRFKLFFRVAYLIPYMMASVVSAAIWRALLSPDVGFGRVFGINFLGDMDWALVSVMFVDNWHWWGFLLVIYFAAMQGVNPNLLEAASLDGAGATRQFFSVIVPGIRPTFMFLGLMTIIWTFLNFDYVYILTQGGPAGSTEVMSTLLYRMAFANLEAGYASAIGVVMAALSGGLIVTYLLIGKKRDWSI
jgi:raffinose/stachyose/melibiose transport system permease protein